MPTEAQVQTAIGDAVRILEHLDRYTNVNAQNFAAHLSTLESDVGPNDFLFADQIIAAAARFRRGLVTTEQLGRGMLIPLLRDYGRVRDFPETDVATILFRLQEDFWDRGLTVESRAFVYGAITATTASAGDGVMNRLTADQRGDDIENTFAESVAAECVQDEHSGATEHEENFEFRGQALGKDPLDLQGSGQKQIIKALSAAASLEFLQNPSFSDNTVGALTTGDTIPGWNVLVGAITDFTIDDASSGQIYRDFDGDTAPKSILFETDATLEQGFNNRRIQLSPEIPMYLQIAYRANTMTSGTLSLRLGNQTTQATITTATTGWNVLRMALGLGSWHKVFNQEDPVVSIAVTSGNGSLWIDDVVFARFVPFNGIWYAPVGGATPFLRRDEFNFAHTNGDRVALTQGLIQHWLWRLFNTYLPHTTATPSWTEPVV